MLLQSVDFERVIATIETAGSRPTCHTYTALHLLLILLEAKPVEFLQPFLFKIPCSCLLIFSAFFFQLLSCFLFFRRRRLYSCEISKY